MERSTWNKKQGVDECANCNRTEHEHVWICFCGRELGWVDKLFPVKCLCGSSRGATLYCPLLRNQFRVVDWVRKVFDEATATNGPERALRLVEEAIELAQACGVGRDALHRLVDYVLDRPVGDPAQEIAGCMVTLYAAAHALGVDADEVFEQELSRIQLPEVIDRVRRRQAEKREALVATVGGPLERLKKTTYKPEF
jgi:hypothetical protein